MADDGLLDDKPPVVASDTPEVATKADFDKLSGNLASWAKEETASVTSMRQATQPVVTTPPVADPPPDDFLDAFVKDGRGTLKREVQDTIRDSLGPWLQSQVTSEAENLKTNAKASLDATYGVGAYDEVVAPKMEAILGQMDPQTQLIARGSKQTFDAILRQARGDDAVLDALLDRREKMRSPNPPPEMLGVSRDRPTTKATLNQDDLEWIAKYEELGHKVDRKVLSDLLDHRRKNGGWNIQNLGGRNKLNLER